MGTGGTISGTARFLKEQNPHIHVVGADPEGSIYSGDTPKSYKVEGIGMSYLPRDRRHARDRQILRISDEESFLMARRVAREEGLLVGGSSGTAVAAAVASPTTLPPEAILVVIMPDSGRGYMSKIFNDEWMIANGFIGDDKRKDTVGDVLRSKQPLPPMITVTRHASCGGARSAAHVRDLADPRYARRPSRRHVNDVAVMQAVFDHADLLAQAGQRGHGPAVSDARSRRRLDRAYKL